MTPDRIVAQFKKNWKGSEDDLEEAIELLVNDILDSIRLAGGEDELVEEVEDYAENHYFS